MSVQPTGLADASNIVIVVDDVSAAVVTTFLYPRCPLWLQRLESLCELPRWVAQENSHPCSVVGLEEDKLLDHQGLFSQLNERLSTVCKSPHVICPMVLVASTPKKSEVAI